MNKVLREDFEEIASRDLPYNEFKNKNILITGASGFLASYMVEFLLFLDKKQNLGIKIFALVRNLDSAHLKFKKYLNEGNLHIIHQDVCVPVSINEKVHFIVHAASQASPKYYSVDPIGTLRPNVIGTLSLLDFATKNPVESFLFFSSSEIYGQMDENSIPTKEDQIGYLNPIDIRSCYAESKKMGENACVSYFHQHRIPVKIVRPFHTYGPGLDLNDGRVFADFVSNILAGRNIDLKSEGSAKRAFCYVLDATVGFLTVLLKGHSGQAYNIGNPKAEISILDLAETLVGIFPEKQLQVNKALRSGQDKYVPSLVLRNCPDISKVCELGWAPIYDIKAGFKRTIEGFENA